MAVVDPRRSHGPGKSVRQTAAREVKEETGYDVEVAGVVGIYTDPRHVIAYSDGEVRSHFSICVTANVTGGSARTPVRAMPGRRNDLPTHPECGHILAADPDRQPRSPLPVTPRPHGR
ncbi:NUDIX hydrolase [Myceligenerans xiligouense]|uniref:NUDIX hydrolase n=1 Tax=Myceligenerans xiligouense TaxID=253184 RepID=UPI000F4F2E1B|nr:NUDIX domain-containing protein [Myceligenerans xiligouense]